MLFRSATLPPSLVGDQLRVRQILVNLVDNAIKFSSDDTVLVRISSQTDDAKKVRVRLEVIDQGIGLTEEQQNRIFAPFMQANDSISRRFGGTGLGLSIVQRLAGLMGGTAGVFSKPNEGSTFWVEIMMDLPASSGLIQEDESGPQADKEWTDSFSGRYFLLAEDDLHTQQVLTQFLAPTGAKLDVASDGNQVLAKFRVKKYDLILMDIQMPNLDGLSATRQIRETQNPNRAVPIIALTANAIADTKRACQEAGMNDYLTKPISFSVLCRHIQKVLHG